MSTSTKIATGAGLAFVLPIILVAAAASAMVAAVFGSNTSQPSQTALADIPADYLALYQQAATHCPRLDWSILAAIGKIETNHGRSPLPGVAPETQNFAGARGPMQFLQPTFDRVIARHTIPPGGQNPPSPWNKHDAIYAAMFYLCDNLTNTSRTCPPRQPPATAGKPPDPVGKAFYLCDNGAPGDLHKAIFAYNHADWYVDKVLAQAAQYSQPALNRSVECGTSQDLTSVAMQAVRFACSQLGKPYVWGGNGDPGFDCSGLTKAAYASAGIDLPRTAQTQYNAGPRLPAGTPPQPGDLLFFGAPDHIHHVGISLGGTQMVNAPTFNNPVRIQDYRGFRDFAGLSRPGLARGG